MNIVLIGGNRHGHETTIYHGNKLTIASNDDPKERLTYTNRGYEDDRGLTVFGLDGLEDDQIEELAFS